MKEAKRIATKATFAYKELYKTLQVSKGCSKHWNAFISNYFGY